MFLFKSEILLLRTSTYLRCPPVFPQIRTVNKVKSAQVTQEFQGTTSYYFTAFTHLNVLNDFSVGDQVEEKGVIQTTHTHRFVSTSSVFLQRQNEPLNSTYFDQKIPIPEDNSEVTEPA